jgi:hypothetical protein
MTHIIWTLFHVVLITESGAFIEVGAQARAQVEWPLPCSNGSCRVTISLAVGRFKISSDCTLFLYEASHRNINGMF